MSALTAVRLTHANLKQAMYVTKQLIAGFYSSPAHKCTHVVMSGGAVFPALETEEDLKRLVYGGDISDKAVAESGPTGGASS